MRKTVEDRGGVLSVRARSDDAIARIRRMQKSVRARLASDQPQLLTNSERDLLLLAIAQSLGIIT